MADADDSMRYPVGVLRSFVVDVLTGCDVLPEHAATTADRMMEADLRGASAHGIYRLPDYVRRLRAGGYNLRPHIRPVRETSVSALIEGDNALGQVAVSHAVQTAVHKAAEHGLAWVGLRGSNHAGAAGVYAATATEHDLIGLYMSVGSANQMPPWGGVDKLLSTNPLAIGIPAGEEPPMVLDIATTVSSYGRIKLAADAGEAMPVGWVMDRTGEPITDPARAREGFLVPIGGYKGYGLNLAIGFLAGVLNGAAFGTDVVNFLDDHATPANTGQLVIAVRPDLFRPLAEFKREMDAKIREIRASRPMEGHDAPRIPGDRAWALSERMTADGVPLTPGTAARLRDVAAEIGLGAHPFD